MALMCSHEGKYIRIAYPSVSHPREGDGALRRTCRPTESVAILGRRRWFVSASNGYIRANSRRPSPTPIPFERSADDIIAHCHSAVQAHWLKARIAARLAQCHLELHPDKTHIVYGKDADRRGS